MHDKQVRRRRAVLALLVGISLILLTAYFGESADSPLHSVQRGIVEVFSPIQDGASKVLSPVRDIAGWFSSTLNAKSQVGQLRKQVDRLNGELATAQREAIEEPQLASELKLDTNDNISSYQPVGAEVIGRDPLVWYQTIMVDKGYDDGVRQGDPVLGDGALVGDVSTVGADFSIVTLITDHTFAVAAEVLDRNGDTGILQPQVGNPNRLLLGSLPQLSPGQPGAPQYDDQVVTAGFKDPGDPQASGSLYPAGIPIGTVSNVNENTLYNDQQIQVAPDADLRHLSAVQVLTKPTNGTDSANASSERASAGTSSAGTPAG